MHAVGSGILSLLYEVYQCTFVDLKWIQAIQTCSIIIGRLCQNIPTTFTDFLVFHVSSGYGIQYFVHIVNVTEKQAQKFLTKLCSSYRAILLQGRIHPVFYQEAETSLWCG